MSIDVRTSRKQLLEEQQRHQDYLMIALAIFKRKWWLVIIILFISVVFTYYYSEVPEGPYKATALIRPVMGSTGGMFSIPIGGGGMSSGASGFLGMDTEFEIIKGKKVAEKVIDKLGLTELYKKPTNDNKNKLKNEVPEVPIRSISPELKKRFLVSELQGRLEVGWQENEAKRRINLVEITARSYSPKEAMEIANATAETYIEVYDSYKQMAWQELISLLEIELKKAQANMEDARNQLYQSANEKEIAAAFSSVLGGSMYVPSDIPMGIAALKSRIVELETQLQILRKDYSDLEPRVASIKKEVDELKKRLVQEEAKAREKFGEQYGLSKLSAQVLFNEQLYQTLVSNHQHLKAQYIMEKQSPEIIEMALEPLSPSSLSKRSGLPLAAVIGLALGIILSLFFEFLDTTLRTVVDVANQIGIPVIGKIPRLRDVKNRPESDTLITYKGGDSSRKSWIRKQYKESFRILQFEALAAVNEGNNFIQDNSLANGIAIVLASSAPDEGKSTIAANLAISIAQTGRKVLLMDSDSRQPKQHKLFGIDQDSTPKLCDVLLERAKIEEACRESSVDNLYLMISGNNDDVVDNTALLSSPKMQELINLLKGKFHVIILDSPATSIASESAAIGSMADGIIIVVKNESTKKNDALQTKEKIQYSGGNILGVVLNFANAEKKDRKYY